MSRRKRFFLFVGIPCLILIILFTMFFWFDTALIIALIGLVLYLSFLHRKLKRDPYIRISKFLVIIFAINFVSFASLVSPDDWGQQFIVNIDKSKLIEPDHPVIASLEDYFFNTWLASNPVLTDSYAFYIEGSLIPFDRNDFRSLTISVDFSVMDYSELPNATKLMVIDYFINSIIIDWTSDTIVYGSNDYKGTVDQVLAEGYASGWTEVSHDDCDGIAVVTVSFLQHLGFNAFIGSGISHWYTVVEPNPTDEFIRPVLLNYWSSVHVFYYFNQHEFKLGQPIINTILDSWFLDEMYPELQAVLDIFQGNILLIFLVSLVLSFIIVSFIGYPRSHSEQEQNEIKREQTIRAEKIAKNKILSHKFSPVHWILLGTYIRTGNPFNKKYMYFWVDIMWVTIASFLVLLGVFQLLNAYWLFTYLLISVWALISLVDGQYSQKIGIFITAKVKSKNTSRNLTM